MVDFWMHRRKFLIAPRFAVPRPLAKRCVQLLDGRSQAPRSFPVAGFAQDVNRLLDRRRSVAFLWWATAAAILGETRTAFLWWATAVTLLWAARAAILVPWPSSLLELLVNLFGPVRKRLSDLGVAPLFQLPYGHAQVFHHPLHDLLRRPLGAIRLSIARPLVRPLRQQSNPIQPVPSHLHGRRLRRLLELADGNAIWFDGLGLLGNRRSSP
jgi:hypothetical protein